MTYRSIGITLAIIVAYVAFSFIGARTAVGAGAGVPAPTADDALAAKSDPQTVVLAGGCFWGVQLVFEHVKGVSSAIDGYSGGGLKNPSYEDVSSGTTGHAESVKVTYDPAQITFGHLLQIYFSVVTDPTELNYQGPDEGTQYRGAIFYTTPDQQRIANAYIAQLDDAHVFKHKIVTEVTPFDAFYQAEAYHQDYAERNPYSPYIAMYDAPKLRNLKSTFPDFYVAKR